MKTQLKQTVPQKIHLVKVTDNSKFYEQRLQEEKERLEREQKQKEYQRGDSRVKAEKIKGMFYNMLTEITKESGN